MDIYQKINEPKGKKELAIATVINVKGSTPRVPGAKMLIMASGQEGTIGGGELERLVLEDAKQVLASKTPMKKEYTLAPEEEGGIGMYCGGTVEVFIEYLPAEAQLILQDGFTGYVPVHHALIAGGSEFHQDIIGGRGEPRISPELEP